MTKRKDQSYRSDKCLNCNTSLDVSEKYCHYCGQLNSTKKITISDFVEEFFSNFYSYDSRLRNSIISIFTKPGILAKEFNLGKRQKYANPFRLFLSISFVLFISFNLTEGDKTPINLDKQISIIESDSVIVTSKLLKNDTKIKRVKNLSIDSIYTKKELTDNYINELKHLQFQITSFRNFHIKNPKMNEKEVLNKLGYENNFKNTLLFKKSKTFKSNYLYSELTEYFYQKLPLLIFISLPIFTIFFWLVFYSKKINYTEHLVFTYTFYSFLFTCMIFFNLIGFINDDVSTIIASICFFIIFPLYFYKSLRNFYQLSRWKTIFKFLILNPLFILFLIISSIMMIFLGLILL